MPIQSAAVADGQHMTLSGIEDALPWGLHDAYLEALDIDWPNAKLIHLCGRRAELEWIEPEPVAFRAATRALFPGDTVPDAARKAR
jgi:hypothetical protein